MHIPFDMGEIYGYYRSYFRNEKIFSIGMEHSYRNNQMKGSYSSQVFRECRFVSPSLILHILKWPGFVTKKIINKCNQSVPRYDWYNNTLRRD